MFIGPFYVFQILQIEKMSPNTWAHCSQRIVSMIVVWQRRVAVATQTVKSHELKLSKWRDGASEARHLISILIYDRVLNKFDSFWGQLSQILPP